MTQLRGCVALVAGGNRGVGRAIDELLARGAVKVYAGARVPGEADVAGAELVQLDITDPAQVALAAAHCHDVTVLANDAGEVPAAFMGGYSTSKAAMWFLSAITRAELAEQGTQVTSLVLGSVDTRMAAHVEGKKEDPREIARVGLDAVEAGDQTVATDKMAIDAMAAHGADPEGFERLLGRLLHVDTLRAPR